MQLDLIRRVQLEFAAMEEASAMLRVLAFVGARYGDDRAMALQLCTGMVHVAAGLALVATGGQRLHCQR